MKKRVLSLFMALTLCLFMQPTTTFAEEAGAVTEQETQSGVNTADVYIANEDVGGGDVSGGNVSSGDAALQEQKDEETNVAVEAAQEEVHIGEHGFELPEGQAWQAVKDEEELRAAAANGYYYLTDSITLNSTWTPAAGTVLCLNGHSITVEAEGVAAIAVSENVKFTLTDCTGNGTITHSSGKNGSGVEVQDKGTFTMYGGTISGNTASSICGGGVDMTGGSVFTMYGGAISGNTASMMGGGVFVDAPATFYMTGGTINVI